ncbi:MAG: kelch repeat-containing protein [Verrucomicrobiota bacterium]
MLDIISVEQWDRKKVLGKLKSKDFQKAAGNKDIPTEVFRSLAVDGFGILGTNAEPAIPQLTKLLYGSPECQSEVACALVHIGPKGFAVLTNATNNDDLVGVLVQTIGQKGGGDVKTVTRILISALKDSSAAVRGNAAYFLSGKDATLAVPALIPMLDDSQEYPRQRAALALGSFGPAAKSAVPKLWSVYTNSPDVFVMGALKAIDKEVARQAEEFLVNSGPLNDARKGYTRTKLTNGLELIVGGWIHTEIPIVTNRYLSSAELLDPVTGKWMKTGEMHIARVGHAAVLLRDGRVLVAGGRVKGNNALSSAELYDPTTGVWKETSSMNAAHRTACGILQSNGRVLIFSGRGNRNSPATDKELYNPATETWKTIPEEPAFDKALYNDYTDTWALPPRHKDYE